MEAVRRAQVGVVEGEGEAAELVALERGVAREGALFAEERVAADLGEDVLGLAGVGVDEEWEMN